ncbi:DUF3047 domain-containing protein [Rubrivirga sp.]|uniref:DUF3047 domain-containing protein n=1 Tax=Rubrivirga sp. TaxID=1885344 RepID=UPI003B51E5E7
MTRPRLLTLGTLVLSLGLAAFAPSDYVVASFSNMRPGGSINGWETMSLGDAPHSQYALVRDGSTTVVRGRADGSASGLVRRIDLDANRFPVLVWRWKADNVIPGGDIRRRSGDDYPARIYVTFDYDPSDLSFGDRVKYRALRALGYDDIPVRALSYVWANKAGETQIVPNAFTDWVQMVPVQSGASGLGQWQTERRDVVRDYRAAFGEDPPPISGIAIMTDADNTGGSATAYFGDIRMTTR